VDLCHNFQYFGKYIAIFWRKYSLAVHLVEINTDPDPDRPWIPIRIRISQNDADPTGFGSTTLVCKVQNAQWHTYSHLKLMSATQEVLRYRITETSDTSRHKFNPFYNAKTEIKTV
jgi:hypothetical protein